MRGYVVFVVSTVILACLLINLSSATSVGVSSGVPGYYRATSPRGPKGQKGVAGVRGPPGRQGLRGPRGDRGYTGRSGKSGQSGKPGPRGFVGSPGRPGLRGPAGFRGKPGIGDKGDRGAKGVRGYLGFPGTPGPPGQMGIQGAKGSPGLPGPEGPQGKCEKGDEGKEGAQGPPGNPGRKGEKGCTGFGDPGNNGIPGPSGDTFVYWGSNMCAGSSSSILHSGVAVTDNGGNPLCVPLYCGAGQNGVCASFTIDSALSFTFKWDKSTVTEIGYLKGKNLLRLECSLCFDSQAATVVTIPAVNECPTNWCLKYTGVLAKVQQSTGDYFCVNPNEPLIDVARSGVPESPPFVGDPHKLSLVEGNCFGSECGEDGLTDPLNFPCVVCSFSNLNPCLAG